MIQFTVKLYGEGERERERERERGEAGRVREGEREREKEKKSGKSNNERERSRYEPVLCTVIAYIMSYPKREIIIIYRLFLVHLIGRSRGQERVHW